MKSMAAIFTAFDHPNYQRLISQHLADIPTTPAPIIAMFKQGAFVVSLSGRPWHSVAIDEAHEMNKDCKSAVMRPLPTRDVLRHASTEFLDHTFSESEFNDVSEFIWIAKTVAI